MSQPANLPDKREVAASFSRAASSYDAVAALQRRVAEQLLDRLPGGTPPPRWLDLGSGTGFCSRLLAARYPRAEGLALDLAEGMLRHARAAGCTALPVCGDAERLPLRDGCVDLVLSSLALQWCGDFPAVLHEARRVLRPGGILAFSSLCSGTLQELRDSWQAVDGYAHVNRFRDLADYRDACSRSGLTPLRLDQVAEVLYFPELRQLTHELKALGAHNLNPGRPGGLTGRARLRALTEAYERQRTPAGLPATYQVVYGVLRNGA